VENLAKAEIIQIENQIKQEFTQVHPTPMLAKESQAQKSEEGIVRERPQIMIAGAPFNSENADKIGEKMQKQIKLANIEDQA